MLQENKLKDEIDYKDSKLLIH